MLLAGISGFGVLRKGSLGQKLGVKVFPADAHSSSKMHVPDWQYTSQELCTTVRPAEKRRRTRGRDRIEEWKETGKSYWHGNKNKTVIPSKARAKLLPNGLWIITRDSMSCISSGVNRSRAPAMVRPLQHWETGEI
ncbi:hypothetical protein I7I50_06511 [Histoplasma capsulatum G186AR]|uniref:Uncharacterized protein n=1 Tax=Ajellomyces capsulatus TaxID=5037 RepID=A0A8H7Z2I1_AJECA|nr:hypothetical protein I7I52_10417 [Histoplasma capsulatum]QSS67433.1 hypothetical protein I7I50_06511 [Histoplasma capsulatum G186AR]